MSQYDQSAPKKISKSDNKQTADISTLSQQIQQQQHRIELLETQIRRLKNEIRLAVNNINIERG